MLDASKVLGHITGKSKPNREEDEDWAFIDSRVKSCFYFTWDPSLFTNYHYLLMHYKRYMGQPSWVFHNNKMP